MLKDLIDPRSPEAVLLGDVEHGCWASTGWEDACDGTVRDAATTTRGQAAAYVASQTTGHLPDVRVWKRYIMLWTRQSSWDYSGRDRWGDDHDLAYEDTPAVPPREWIPDDYQPSWSFVHRSHPKAIAVWIVGFKGDNPPDNPGVQA